MSTVTGTANGHQPSPRRVMTKNVRELAHDAVTLGELQVELLKLDASDWSQRLVPPLLALAATLGVALGTLPVLLQVLAYALIEGAGWSAWLSFLVAGIAGLVLAALLGTIGWTRLRASFDVFQRSRDEMQKNVTWLKQVLSQPCEDEMPSSARPARRSFDRV